MTVDDTAGFGLIQDDETSYWLWVDPSAGAGLQLKTKEIFDFRNGGTTHGHHTPILSVNKRNKL